MEVGHSAAHLGGSPAPHFCAPEQLEVFEAHTRRDSALQPVGNTLHPASLLVPEQPSERGRTAKRFDQFCITHAAITRHVYSSVNAALNNGASGSPKIRRMHASVKRLLNCAREATARSRAPVTNFAELGARLGASSATMTNWKARGVSKEGALKAEAAFGCSAQWILSGEGKPRPQDAGDAPAAPPSSYWRHVADVAAELVDTGQLPPPVSLTKFLQFVDFFAENMPEEDEADDDKLRGSVKRHLRLVA